MPYRLGSTPEQLFICVDQVPSILNSKTPSEGTLRLRSETPKSKQKARVGVYCSTLALATCAHALRNHLPSHGHSLFFLGTLPQTQHQEVQHILRFTAPEWKPCCKSRINFLCGLFCVEYHHGNLLASGLFTASPSPSSVTPLSPSPFGWRSLSMHSHAPLTPFLIQPWAEPHLDSEASIQVTTLAKKTL